MHGIAAFPGSTLAQWVEVPEPGRPAAGEVLCRTLELGICGTDREILEAGEPFTPPSEPFLVLGHECLAEVVEVGAGVEWPRPNDLVVPVVRRAAAELGPRVDMLPPGTYTERGIVAEHGFSLPLWIDYPRHLFAVPASLRPFAVLTEPVAVAEKGINEALLLQHARFETAAWHEKPPRVLVTGMGPIGFAAVLAARARGWPTTLYGRDADDSPRVATARLFGAEYLSESQARFTRFAGDHEAAQAEGYDLLLECTGSESVLVDAAAAVAPGGVLVWLGSLRTTQPRELQVARMMRDSLLRNHLHLGCVNAAPRDFRDALWHVQWWSERAPKALNSLVTQRVAPRESLPFYQRRPPHSIKSILDFADR